MSRASYVALDVLAASRRTEGSRFRIHPGDLHAAERLLAAGLLSHQGASQYRGWLITERGERMVRVLATVLGEAIEIGTRRKS